MKDKIIIKVNNDKIKIKKNQLKKRYSELITRKNLKSITIIINNKELSLFQSFFYIVNNVSE